MFCSALFKSNQLSFEMLESIQKFYKEGFEQDKNVRSLWYLFCFHFLTVINRDWKNCLKGSRVLKPTFLYEHISTSDQAMVLWMIKSWEPKIRDQAERNWPGFENTAAEGEQELRAGLQEYIGYYTLISNFKQKQDGELACKWSDIFWEEMVVNHPNIYKKGSTEIQNQLLENNEQSSEDAVVLPGMDDDNNDLIGAFNKRKSIKKKVTNNTTILTKDKETENPLENEDLLHTAIESNNNGGGSLDENNPNSEILPGGIFLEEIKNNTEI